MPIWVAKEGPAGLSTGRREVLANQGPWEGKQGSAQSVLCQEGQVLIQTGDVVGRRKEHFEELLNRVNTSSCQEAKYEDSIISLAGVTQVAPEVDESHPVMLFWTLWGHLGWHDFAVSRGDYRDNG